MNKIEYDWSELIDLNETRIENIKRIQRLYPNLPSKTIESRYYKLKSPEKYIKSVVKTVNTNKLVNVELIVNNVSNLLHSIKGCYNMNKNKVVNSICRVVLDSSYDYINVSNVNMGNNSFDIQFKGIYGNVCDVSIKENMNLKDIEESLSKCFLKLCSAESVCDSSIIDMSSISKVLNKII